MRPSTCPSRPSNSCRCSTNLLHLQEPPPPGDCAGRPAGLLQLLAQEDCAAAQRIGIRATIRPLTKAESLAYIRQRVAKVALPGGPIFTEGALQAIGATPTGCHAM